MYNRSSLKQIHFVAMILLVSAIACGGSSYAQDQASKLPSPSQNVAADIKALNQLNKKTADALRANKPADLQSLILDDALILGGDGARLDKKAYLAQLESGRRSYTSYEIAEPTIKLYGNAAMVSGTGTTEGIVQDRAFNVKIGYVKLFVKEKGAWKVAFWQTSTM